MSWSARRLDNIARTCVTDRVSAGASIGWRNRHRLGSPSLSGSSTSVLPARTNVSLRTSPGFSDKIVKISKRKGVLGQHLEDRVRQRQDGLVVLQSSEDRLPEHVVPADSQYQRGIARRRSCGRFRPSRLPDLDGHDGRIELGILDVIRREELAGLEPGQSGSGMR